MTDALILLAALAAALWLGIRIGVRAAKANERIRTEIHQLPPDRGVTPPGRLIDHGAVMDPDRLFRVIE